MPTAAPMIDKESNDPAGRFTAGLHLDEIKPGVIYVGFDEVPQILDILSHQPEKKPLGNKKGGLAAHLPLGQRDFQRRIYITAPITVQPTPHPVGTAWGGR